ncbi:MAG: MATE family efflux transporter [Planctomycetota bacterium]|nr:MATE family efflux transporter [Planctomycetota bacterium]
MSSNEAESSPEETTPEPNREYDQGTVFPPGSGGSWKRIWHQPCGPGEVLAIGLPLVLSTLSYSVMQFCDRLFLSWHSEEEMAAVMSAVVLNWTASCLPIGIASYAATFVAQYCGSRQERNVGPMIWTAMWIGVFFIPLFVVLSVFPERVFRWFGHPEDLVPLESIYFRIACIGSAAVVFESALASFFIGRGKTRIVMVTNLAAMLINLVLDGSFIFGWGWIPEMGIRGAAWATTIAVWLKVVVYLVLVTRPGNIRRFGLDRGIRLQGSLLAKLVRFGGPSGWQLWMEGLAISLFVLWIGRIGRVEAAATTLAFSVNLIAFVPLVGLGMSVSTLVGQKIGSGEIHLARRAVHYGMLIGLIYSACFALLYSFAPQVFLQLYSLGGEKEHFAEIAELSRFLLRFVATYCVLDCVQVIFAAALKGAGDTRFIFLFTIINALLFVLLGIIGSLYLAPQQELTVWWSAITLWILAYAIAFSLRYLGGHWTRMSVVDLTAESN